MHVHSHIELDEKNAFGISGVDAGWNPPLNLSLPLLSQTNACISRYWTPMQRSPSISKIEFKPRLWQSSQ